MKHSFTLLCALLLASCDEISSRYATTDEARERKLFEKGWLPDVLPESATDIRITSDVDVSTCHGEFRLASSDVDAFLARLTVGAPAFRHDAWKDELHRLGAEGHTVMSYPSRRATYAFVCHRHEQRCEFWCGS